MECCVSVSTETVLQIVKFYTVVKRILKLRSFVGVNVYGICFVVLGPVSQNPISANPGFTF